MGKTKQGVKNGFPLTPIPLRFRWKEKGGSRGSSSQREK